MLIHSPQLLGSSAYKPPVASGGSDPSTIFGSNLVFWLKGDAGTSSTTNGANLTSWTDQSSNAISFTNLGSPKYDTTDALNGHAVVDCRTGTSSGFFSGTFSWGTVSTCSCFAVIQNRTFTGASSRVFSIYDPVTDNNDNGAHGGAFMLFPNSTDFLIQRNGNQAAASGAIANATWVMVCSVFDTTDALYTSNGSAFSSVGTHADANGAFTTTPQFLVSGHSPTLGDQTALIAEMVVTKNSASSGDRASMWSYFHTRYGIS